MFVGLDPTPVIHGLFEYGLCKATVKDDICCSQDEKSQDSVGFEFRTPTYCCDASLLQQISAFVAADLSEPYSTFTFRFFVERYAHVCIIVYDVSTQPLKPENVLRTCSALSAGRSRVDICFEPPFGSLIQRPGVDGKIVGVVISQLIEPSPSAASVAGYIGMVAVHPDYRRQGLGRLLVKTTVGLMTLSGATEVLLETEVTNVKALRLYENEGFVRIGRKTRYYLNGGDAFVLKKSILPRIR